MNQLIELQGIRVEAKAARNPIEFGSMGINLQASAAKRVVAVDTGQDGKILAELTAHCQAKKLDNPLGSFQLTPEEMGARIGRVNALKAAIYDDRDISNSNRNIFVNYLSEYTRELKRILGRATAFAFLDERQARAVEARRLSAASVGAKPKRISASRLAKLLLGGRSRARMTLRECTANLPIGPEELQRLENGEIFELPAVVLIALAENLALDASEVLLAYKIDQASRRG
jgi:hypothetical protein